MNSDIICPYCGMDLDICNDDIFELDDNFLHQEECSHCGKIFSFKFSVSIDYDAYRCDCHNGGDHNWTPTKTYPKEFTKMKCTICDEKRDCTEEEMKEVLK